MLLLRCTRKAPKSPQKIKKALNYALTIPGRLKSYGRWGLDREKNERRCTGSPRKGTIAWSWEDTFNKTKWKRGWWKRWGRTTVCVKNLLLVDWGPGYGPATGAFYCIDQDKTGAVGGDLPAWSTGVDGMNAMRTGAEWMWLGSNRGTEHMAAEDWPGLNRSHRDIHFLHRCKMLLTRGLPECCSYRGLTLHRELYDEETKGN